MTRPTHPFPGIAYAVLVVTGVLMLVREEIDGATDDQIVTYYGDSGNRTVEMIGSFAIVLGGLAFLWFLASLRTRLRSVESDSTVLSDLAFGAGVAATTLLLGATVLLSATSSTIAISSGFVVDPNTARLAVAAGYLFLIGAVLMNCVVVAATSMLALRSDGLPNWLAWLGGSAVVLAVVEAFLLPVFVIPAWVAVVSIVFARGTTSETQEESESGEMLHVS